MWKTKTFVLAAFLVLIVAACSSDDAENNPPQGPSDTAAPSGAPDADPNAPGGFETPDIDASTMPPAGDARVEVDGQTFVFRQSEMLEGPFTCEIRDNGITVNYQSDGHDMVLQGATQPDGTILASTTVVPEESDFRYSSTNGGLDGVGGAATDGNYVVYVGRFDATPKDNLATFSDVGKGTVYVTCP